jgi:hypothetical protein
VKKYSQLDEKLQVQWLYWSFDLIKYIVQTTNEKILSHKEAYII